MEEPCKAWDGLYWRPGGLGLVMEVLEHGADGATFRRLHARGAKWNLGGKHFGPDEVPPTEACSTTLPACMAKPVQLFREGWPCRALLSLLGAGLKA